MAIQVEFFGIPRSRAGVASATVGGDCLGDVLVALERDYPGLQGTCIEKGQLLPGFVANLSGNDFVTDPETRLSDGDAVLILSADAGG